MLAPNAPHRGAMPPRYCYRYCCVRAHAKSNGVLPRSLQWLRAWKICSEPFAELNFVFSAVSHKVYRCGYSPLFRYGLTNAI